MSLTQKLFSWNGRIRRRDWWLLYIISAVILYGLAFAIMMLVGQPDPTTGQVTNPAGMIGFIFYIPLIWISLALTAKRFHDRDKGAIWVLIGLVPFIGGLWILIECGFLDGTPGPNRFGPSPKGIGGTAESFA